jgi:PAS domain S-box-containing protein
MIFLNESGSKMLGIDPEKINQFNILQVIPDHMINLVQTELLPSLMNGGTWEGDLQYKNIVNGNIVDVHAMTFVVFEQNTKNPLYFANVSVDITDRKKAEEKLRQAYVVMSKMNEDLELKVKERTAEIKNLLIQKDEFINQLGHDLKNPLGPLINLLPLLEKQEDDPKKKAMITVMLRNTGYMKNLVTKTLKLARLNSPNTKLSLESYSLKNQLFQIIENNKLQFDEKHMTIINNISAELIVNADKLHFEELFTNLINNSVKYSNEFGKIIINAEENECEIKLSIRDNGIGMTREQLSKLFSEFFV